MALLNKLFKKKKIAEVPKKRVILESKILISSHTAEKALMGQKLNQYVFKVNPTANKIMIANEVKKNYNVKAIKVNIVNIPKKNRRVGKNQGFRAGYKKAIVTLAKGQTIELK
ncbi:MAG: 50S ribosomal protein L23 [Patescibacteria group bacterium]